LVAKLVIATAASQGTGVEINGLVGMPCSYRILVVEQTRVVQQPQVQNYQIVLHKV